MPRRLTCPLVPFQAEGGKLLAIEPWMVEVRSTSRKRFSTEQIIHRLREAEVELTKGRAIAKVSRQLGLSSDASGVTCAETLPNDQGESG